MKKMHDTAPIPEKAVLVAVNTQRQPKGQAEEYLHELAFLAETAGAITVGSLMQRMEYPDPRTYLGSGKMNELLQLVLDKEADMIIVDDELKPSQIRNMERALNEGRTMDDGIKVMDRATLILDIFANRAQTAQARTQVELAQNEYLLPRLTNLWTHLSKQKGGIGMKGPGETEIETDRRIIRDRISLLKEKLKTIDRQNFTMRRNREAIVRVSLVGYTNVGKSTIMNLLSKSDVFAENKLFATLDATVRKVVMDRVPFLLSDTVGFIRKLPHQLVESFKSTLDEVREADVLLHIVDVSHPAFEDHIRVVQETLRELKVEAKPTLYVYNKIDALPSYPVIEDPFAPEGDVKHPITLAELETSWMAKQGDAVFISAAQKTNIDALKSRVLALVRESYTANYPNVFVEG